MPPLWLLMCMTAGAAMAELSPATLQLPNFAAQAKEPIGILTTESGCPVEKKNTKALNTDIMRNEALMDELTHVVRERIPERSVHAKGTGAFGYFESTYDFSNYTKAELFSGKGKKTKVAVRFSNGSGGRDSTDIIKDTHGMAVKFYTEKGNFDLIGFGTPIVGFKDPAQSVAFIHAFKKNPVAGVFDSSAKWDFITLNPECMYLVMNLYGDKGIPKNYRFLPGHTVHTYQMYNADGETFFARFHFMPDQGEDYLDNEEAATLASDPDHFVSDLYNAIENGNYPSWTFYVQLLTLKQFLEGNPSQLIDVTREIPKDMYPYMPIGKIVLNENVKNHFANVEQAAYNPGNVVPGILGAPDKIYETRQLVYRDAQYYRLGGNFKRIPINCPLRALTVNRDGEPYLGDNFGGMPNYYPNSFNGGVPYEDPLKPPMIKVFEEEADNFNQARLYYTQEMSEKSREELISTLVTSLNDTQVYMQERAVQLFANIHPDFCSRVADQLGLSDNLCYFIDDKL